MMCFKGVLQCIVYSFVVFQECVECEIGQVVLINCGDVIVIVFDRMMWIVDVSFKVIVVFRD